MPAFVLAAVPAAPALATIGIALRLVRGERSIARCVVGASLVALALSVVAMVCGDAPLAALVAFAVALIGLIVSGFASRSMQGASVSYTPFFTGLAAATASSLAIAVSSDLRVLAAAWIATGLCTSALLATGGTPRARSWALRHLVVERIGDCALIAILVMTWNVYKTFDLATLAHVVGLSSTNGVIAVLLVVAGMVRSAIVPFQGWLPNSMEAPTPISAFMHAGLVNGAGVLLAKTAFFIVVSPAALALAAIAGAVTATLGAAIALVRPETKRRLGWSTVAQMGFMVLQCGCGAFSAAVVHLVAHGGYKSAAFLAAAGSIENHKRADQPAAIPAARKNAFFLAFNAFAPATIGVAAAGMLLHNRLIDLPAASMVLATAWAAGTSAARRGAECALDVAARVTAFVTVAGAVSAYLFCVTMIDGWLGAGLPHMTFVPAAALVTAIALGAGVFAGLGVRARLPDALYTFALIEGSTTRLERAA